MRATYTSLPFPGRIADGLVYSKASRWHEEVLPQEPLPTPVKSQFCISFSFTPPLSLVSSRGSFMFSFSRDAKRMLRQKAGDVLSNTFGRLYRVPATSRWLNHQPKTPAKQPASQLAHPGSARILIYAIPLSLAARALSSALSALRFPFLSPCRPFHRIPRRRELRRTRRTRRERFATAPSLAFVCVYSAHECVNYYGPGGGLLLIGLLTSCSLCSRRRERERRGSHFPRVHDTLFVWCSHAICRYAPRKIGETFTSHI